MSRPGSSSQSTESHQAEEGAMAGPSRSPDFYPQYQADVYRADAPSGWEGGSVNGIPEGRMVYPMSGHPTGVVTVGPHGMPRHLPLSQDEGDFLPIDEASNYGYPQTTPYHPQHPPRHPPHPQHHVHPQYMHSHTPFHPGSTPLPHSTSPTAMMGQHGHPMMQIHSHSPSDGYHIQSTPMPQQYYAAYPTRRPGMQQRHSAMGAPPRPSMMQRGYSLHAPPPNRPVDPAGQDVFAPLPGSTPIRRPASAIGDYPPEGTHFFPTLTQGISPARALGPAPSRPGFSPAIDPLITPHTKLPKGAPSSSASTVLTASSTPTSNYSPTEHRDSEHDSPTKPKKKLSEVSLDLPPRRTIVPPVRLNKSTVIGGRTSAKFAKVAEDPGVEGVPPGPRPTERPTPSFACIIGQAILRCKAGGLSLEHIYRYVETAYPYFKSGDGAWRNSVRHNLSIHKMFETIPRTEKYPPGKGGIWIIHDEEKIHWPSEDKFIKNFPTTHPHHHVCRQTVHERQKESEAIAKARAEGREYIPKKGKKGRKFAEDGSTDMVRANSSMSDGAGPSSSAGGYNLHHPIPSASSQPALLPVLSVQAEQDSFTPKMAPKILHPPPMFRPLNERSTEDAAPKGTMIPPRFGHKRGLEGDEENVFIAPKRVRVAGPLPLAPIQQESVDDAYVTPERERQMGKGMMSSSFKTPGLVTSTSSPGSSPMPPTILRTAQHPASGLQQMWTQADMPNTSPPFLDAAFDIKPKQQYPALPSDDELVPPTTSTFNLPPPSPAPVPKTPSARSSNLPNRTPRMNVRLTPLGQTQTPRMHDGTPILPPLTGGIFDPLSTPAWEIDGILGRLGENRAIEGKIRMQLLFTPGLSTPSMMNSSVPLGLRSPLTSTDPRKYASPKKLIFGVNVNDTPSSSPSSRALANPLTASAIGELAGASEAGGDGSPKKAPTTSMAAKIGREMRAERERTRSGEIRAGV